MAEAREPGRPPPDDGAEEAALQLRRGIERSRKVIADYRQQLARLARAIATERPLLRWRKD